MVNRPDWANPAEPQIRPTMPTISPITLARLSSCTLPVSWLPISGTCPATALRAWARNEGLTEATRPRIVTSTKSSGNMETKAEYARLETSTPPLSSPNFFTTPNTNAVGVERRCQASTVLMDFSTGFIALTPLPLFRCGCPVKGLANSPASREKSEGGVVLGPGRGGVVPLGHGSGQP